MTTSAQRTPERPRREARREHHRPPWAALPAWIGGHFVQRTSGVATAGLDAGVAVEVSS